MKDTIKIPLSILMTFLLFTYPSLSAQTTVAVMELEPINVDISVVKILSDRLRAELVNTGNFIVVERANMEKIMSEQKLNLSGAISEELLIRFGELLGAQNIIAGSVGKFGSSVYTINARLIDVQTGEIIRTALYDHEGDILALLKSGIKNVALILSGKEAIIKTPSNVEPRRQVTTPKPSNKFSGSTAQYNLPDLPTENVILKNNIVVYRNLEKREVNYVISKDGLNDESVSIPADEIMEVWTIFVQLINQASEEKFGSDSFITSYQSKSGLQIGYAYTDNIMKWFIILGSNDSEEKLFFKKHEPFVEVLVAAFKKIQELDRQEIKNSEE